MKDVDNIKGRRDLGAKLYKIFMYFIVICQTIMIFDEFYLGKTTWIAFNIVVALYFLFRIYLFRRLERLAKKKGVSLADLANNRMDN